MDAILGSARLDQKSLILDPWNGSGTTTSTAARRGYRSIGYDINPVMIVIARARLLPASEADALEPLLQQILTGVSSSSNISPDDPLHSWFHDQTVAEIRLIEQSIRSHLVGKLTLAEDGVNLGYLSSIAAVFYVALFSVSRQLISSFRSTNPTWLRVAKSEEDKVQFGRSEIHQLFTRQINAMTVELFPFCQRQR